MGMFTCCYRRCHTGKTHCLFVPCEDRSTWCRGHISGDTWCKDRRSERREWAIAIVLSKKPPLWGEMSNEVRLAQDDIRWLLTCWPRPTLATAFMSSVKMVNHHYLLSALPELIVWWASNAADVCLTACTLLRSFDGLSNGQQLLILLHSFGFLDCSKSKVCSNCFHPLLVANHLPKEYSPFDYFI